MKRAFALLALAAVVFGATSVAGCHGLRVGTFNVRRFGAEDTDMTKLSKLVASLDVDVLAVQEIQSESRFRDLAARVSRGGRTYRVAISECGGRSAMRLGFLYDERRVALLSTKEYPELAPGGRGRCTDGERPGFVGVFRDGARTVHLLAIHLTPGGEPGDFAKRRVQWERAHTIAAKLREDGASAVVVLGDANSTGYRDDANGERRFVDEKARAAGMQVESSDVACTEYYEKEDGLYAPSLLDHAVATTDLVARNSARVHGYCAELRCDPYRSRTPPPDFADVSDHCPVTIDLAR